jgi:hypothetical protein
MKKIILIFALVLATSLNTQVTAATTSKSEVVVDCMSEAMRLADIDLANGTITIGQYFGRVLYYNSICSISY